jgi:plastocyanin
MKRLLTLAVAGLAAFVVAGSAGADTKTVQITRQGFTPSATTVNVGDSVTWRNSDTTSHQVVANDGSFASPVLTAGQTYTFTFTKGGVTTSYHDSFASSKKGSVKVNAPAATLSLTTQRTTITWGENTTVTGTVSSQAANEPVSLTSQPYGKGTQSIATTQTQTSGTFSFGVAPTIQTSYQAHYKTANSPTATVNVAPLVGFGHSGTRYTAKVTSDLSYAGHYVWVQRKAPAGSFRNVKRVYLSSASRATFTLKLVKGRSILRLVLPDTQAGVGYVASASRLISVTKR